jgi:hypothetical protein
VDRSACPSGAPQRLTTSRRRQLRIRAQLQRRRPQAALHHLERRQAWGAIHATSPAAAEPQAHLRNPASTTTRAFARRQPVVYARAGGSGLTGSLWSGDRGIYVMPARGGNPVRVAENGYSRRSSPPTAAACLPDRRRDGEEADVGRPARRGAARGLQPQVRRRIVSLSPDGKWVAFTELFNAYVAPLPRPAAASS